MFAIKHVTVAKACIHTYLQLNRTNTLRVCPWYGAIAYVQQQRTSITHCSVHFFGESVFLLTRQLISSWVTTPSTACLFVSQWLSMLFFQLLSLKPSNSSPISQWECVCLCISDLSCFVSPSVLGRIICFECLCTINSFHSGDRISIALVVQVTPLKHKCRGSVLINRTQQHGSRKGWVQLRLIDWKLAKTVHSMYFYNFWLVVVLIINDCTNCTSHKTGMSIKCCC